MGISEYQPESNVKPASPPQQQSSPPYAGQKLPRYLIIKFPSDVYNQTKVGGLPVAEISATQPESNILQPIIVPVETQNVSEDNGSKNEVFKFNLCNI